MASKASTAAYVLEQARGAGVVSTRKMFGEYALYCDGKVVALVCDDDVFLKSTEAGRALLGAFEERPPAPGAKNWPVVAGERLEDADWFARLLRATADALPTPKPKKKRV